MLLVEAMSMADTRSSGMHIRVNPGIKAQAEPILAAIGLSFSDVFNLTLHQICLKRKIPFELSAIQLTENGYTTDFEMELLSSSHEAHTAVANGAKTYKSAIELRAALDAEEDDE
jgi:addiction module RelB/DinJ family antitoxin